MARIYSGFCGHASFYEFPDVYVIGGQVYDKATMKPVKGKTFHPKSYTNLSLQHNFFNSCCNGIKTWPVTYTQYIENVIPNRRDMNPYIIDSIDPNYFYTTVAANRLHGNFSVWSQNETFRSELALLKIHRSTLDICWQIGHDKEVLENRTSTIPVKLLPQMTFLYQTDTKLYFYWHCQPFNLMKTENPSSPDRRFCVVDKASGKITIIEAFATMTNHAIWYPTDIIRTNRDVYLTFTQGSSTASIIEKMSLEDKADIPTTISIGGSTSNYITPMSELFSYTPNGNKENILFIHYTGASRIYNTRTNTFTSTTGSTGHLLTTSYSGSYSTTVIKPDIENNKNIVYVMICFRNTAIKLYKLDGNVLTQCHQYTVSGSTWPISYTDGRIAMISNNNTEINEFGIDVEKEQIKLINKYRVSVPNKSILMGMVDSNNNLWYVESSSTDVADIDIFLATPNIISSIRIIFQDPSIEYVGTDVETSLNVAALSTGNDTPYAATDLKLELVGPCKFKSNSNKSIVISTSSTTMTNVPIVVTGEGYINCTATIHNED